MIFKFNYILHLFNNFEIFNITILKSIYAEQPITLMGLRGHAHTLGRSVIGYRLINGDGPLQLLGHINPQWPQAFYPLNAIGSKFDAIEINSNDILMARCIYDSTNRSRFTYVGSTHKDEMCNLYLLYHTR